MWFKKILWFSLGLIVTHGQYCIASNGCDFEFTTPLKVSRPLSVISPNVVLSPVTPNRLYGLEESLVQQFKNVRMQVLKEQNLANETRESLRIAFEVFSLNPEFQRNYVAVTKRDHTFYVPMAMVKTANTPQKKRLKSGKAFQSPVGGKANEGHHVDQEDAIDAENPALVWVLTRTNHKGLNKELHLSADVAGKSHISRGKFSYAQKVMYKEIYRLMQESPEGLSSMQQQARKKRSLEFENLENNF